MEYTDACSLQVCSLFLCSFHKVHVYVMGFYTAFSTMIVRRKSVNHYMLKCADIIEKRVANKPFYKADHFLEDLFIYLEAPQR